MFQHLDNILAKATAIRINLNIDGAPIDSLVHTQPSHSQTSHLLSTALSWGTSFPRSTKKGRQNQQPELMLLDDKLVDAYEQPYLPRTHSHTHSHTHFWSSSGDNITRTSFFNVCVLSPTNELLTRRRHAMLRKRHMHLVPLYVSAVPLCVLRTTLHVICVFDVEVGSGIPVILWSDSWWHSGEALPHSFLEMKWYCCKYVA